MEQQIFQTADKVKITKQAMQEELGDDYKRCWAFAFKYANEKIDYDEQVKRLCDQFELIKSQGEWFVTGANKIVLINEQADSVEQEKEEEEEEQKELSSFSNARQKKPAIEYISQIEMMTFLEDVEEMIKDCKYGKYWGDLEKLKQTVMEQNCATKIEVLTIFNIRSLIEGEQEADERFFDAYPVSTSAWENGHFDCAGNVNYW